MKMEERDKTYKTKLCMRGKKMTQGEFSERVNKVIVDGERRIKKKQELLDESDKLPFGYVGLRPNWPRQNDGIARFFHQNLNGISPDADLAEFEALMHQLLYNAPDFLSFDELNINTRQFGIEQKLREKLKEIDRMAKTNFAEGAEGTGLDFHFYHPGGRMQVIMGTLSGQTNECGQDKLGRWAWVKLKGKNSKTLTVYTAYQVCKGQTHKNPQAKTVAAQERRALLKINHPLAMKSRTAMLTDLQEALKKEKMKGSTIRILMDANTPHDAEDIKTFHRTTCTSCLAIAAITGKLPRTYNLGADNTCIDMAFGCDRVLEALVGLQYKPFYSNGLYDHRELIVDLNIQKLLGGACA